MTTTPGVLPSPTHHAQPRRFIDGAASALTSPFASIVQSDSPWVNHGIPAILALLVYGVENWIPGAILARDELTTNWLHHR